jgi:acetolactate synthase-1/2/3 large subunit
MIGSGVRLAGALDILDEVITALGVPVTTAWTAHDSVATDNPLFCGRPGSIGDRAGNFTVQNSDVLLILGSRLNIRQVSYNWKNFARDAFKIQVDADPAELCKPTVKCEQVFQCDLEIFLSELRRQLTLHEYDFKRHAKWLEWCRERLKAYPGVTEKMRSSGPAMNPYVFFEQLMLKLTNSDIVVCGNGSACVMPFQVGHIKKGMRLFCNSGSASMGYDLPAAVGAAFGRPGQRVICLAGDGSIMFNLQELQTIVHHSLPIKIFVINNMGYLSMRTTQMNFFKGNLVGEGPRSGVTFPNFAAVGAAFGINSTRIEGKDFVRQLDEFLELPGPGLMEVMVDPDQLFEPKLAARQLPDGKIVSPSLEDMWPFLSREELQQNMHSVIRD